jgi:tRNA G18 (ribose-2'-O)-methylase SpoU
VTPQPVLAIARKPPAGTAWLERDDLVVVGIELADPGNVGTLLRSAEASGGIVA